MAHKIIWLIRHGRTPGNREKRYIGLRTDEAPEEESIAEAKRTGERLFLESGSGMIMPVRLCSGPMLRARETAAAFAGVLKAAGITDYDKESIEIIQDLTEIDFGAFEGRNYRELSHDPRYQSWIDSGGTAVFPDGEGREAFTERSLKGFREALGDPDREETIIIVCHGGNIMAVLSRLTGEDYYSFMTEPLGGYRLELEFEDERISDLTYSRLADGDSA